MPVAFITHADCALHSMGALHPESPARLHAISDQLIASGLDINLRHYDAPLASREQLCRVHSPAHVEHIFAEAPQQGMRFIDPDTSMNPHTLNAALRAAGAGVLAVDLLMAGEIDAAFCSVRPPGHHAERERAMGFCFFNNVAVAAAHAMTQHALQRVAIVDFDVHHGNGTEDIFADHAQVLMCSTFQHPFYPHSGADTQRSHMVNVPLASGSGSAEFRAAVQQHWLPALHAQQPQLILVSAGFDAHLEDDMAGLRLTEADYAWVTGQIRTLAEQYCNGRIVSMLEGGYALSALGRSVAAHIRALL
ncbi:MAG: histone deacetylase family protein [Gammaproteobacteria bacterium]